MPRSLFLLELGGIIVALSVMARAASKVGLSPIPLYLLGGLIFGEGGLLPLVVVEEFIEVGAEIGIILLLFMLGLEYTAEELSSNLGASAPAGLLDIALNLTPGILAGIWLGLGPRGGLLLGGITYMSSSGVIAKVLSDLGWMGNRETPSVLSILVIEDLLMAAYLPVIAVLLVGGALMTSIVSIGVAILAVLFVLLAALRWGQAISRVVFSHSDEALLLSIFGLTLFVAGLAEALQVSAAVGAFLMGIGLSGPAAERARDLLTPLRDLFAAVFFVFFGLKIDPRAIPAVLGVALLLALVTGATKIATGWWAARRAGVGPRGRLRAGTALVARGEFSIAIAGIGVAAGMPPEFGALAAAYVLLLAIIGPLLARAASPIMLRSQVPA